MSEITTKAAACPICNQYLLIASIGSFNTDKKVRNEFASMMREGFSIVDVTTENAKANFGYCAKECETEKEANTEQLSLF